MAPLPDYVSGTITLTNGSAAFTGTGTGWLAAAFREGDTILGIEGNPGVTYVIESITDNDAGTLTQPWDGPTGTYEYRMRYLSDGQRVTAQARTLIEMLGNGNLEALAGVTGANNRMPYFTGVGTMDLAVLQPFARELLDDGSAASMRSTLELPAWLATFGIGQTGSPVTITNFNTAAAEAAGLYSFSSGASNGPPDSFTGVLLVANASSTSRMQLAMSVTGVAMWMRQFSGGSWGAWRPVTPQRISNSGGIAWRFASGLQICANFSALQADTNTSTAGSFNGTVSWTFPAPFASGSQTSAFSISGSTIRWGGNATSVSSTGCTLRHFSMSQSATTSNIFGIAIGEYV